MANDRSGDLLTLAAIRETKSGGAEYLFNERARLFQLGTRSRSASRLFSDALKRGTPLKVGLDAKRPIITSVAEAKASDVEAFLHARPRLEKAERNVPIEVSKLTPVQFDAVDRSPKWGAIRLCTRVVPNYAKAKEIFDFCAQLSCSLPGPYAVTPCIPFQYVIDGCYARAHQMRRIISGRYKYCCDKVFSFATANSDRLAVRATKWGGCCVTWWYHVAPIITVRTKLRHWPRFPKDYRPKSITVDLAYVIDPGMFDAPVLLSTWLAAQENTACYASAHVTSYSIQPGSAYTPYYGGGFATDPSYTATEATLLAYSSLTTC